MGTVVAWYGRDQELEGVARVYSSTLTGGKWTRPRVVADGVQPGGNRVPTWNPVLFQPKDGPLLLFYRVGPNPREWSGFVKVSADGGLTWSSPVALPEGYLGPIRTKPVQLGNLDIVMGSSTEHDGWVVHIERFSFPDQGAVTPVDRWTEMLAAPSAWSKTEPLHRLRNFAAIQPAILQHDGDLLQILCRTQQKVIAESWSSDGGLTWSPMVSAGLPNPSAGIDAIRLADGRFVLVSNPTTTGRDELSLFVSDDGLNWSEVFEFERSVGEFSYPAVIQSRDGSINVTYSVKPNMIKHVRLDPTLLAGDGFVPMEVVPDVDG
ncbi:MAG: exo-alpha-sialidase [Rhodothermales bacterium]|nr:exo-alpha-sialidase [Rhodothermales bacterium]